MKCKARWVLRGFQDRQVWDLQTDSPTSTRPGFRLQCQVAANNKWDLTHIDLKTAFLQGDTFGADRSVVCQLPPEAGYKPWQAARLKRAAYGLNDAPRLWWNKLDKALRSYGLVPTRADRCCYVLYSKKSAHFATPEALVDSAHGFEPEKEAISARPLGCCSDQSRQAAHVELAFEAAALTAIDPKESLEQVLAGYDGQPSKPLGQTANPFNLDKSLELLLDPVTGSAAHGRKVEGVVTIHVDDALMAGTEYFKKHVIAGLRKDFQVGSEDTNDCEFVGQRARWYNKGKPGAYIRVDQEKKIEELSEIAFDR